MDNKTGIIMLLAAALFGALIGIEIFRYFNPTQTAKQDLSKVVVLQKQNDSLKLIQDSLEYQVADLNIGIINLQNINEILNEQYKSKKNEIEKINKKRSKIDSSIYLLNVNELSRRLSDRYSIGNKGLFSSY
jgi:cell division protein FtsB